MQENKIFEIFTVEAEKSIELLEKMKNSLIEEFSR